MSGELAVVTETGEIVRRRSGIDSWIEVVSDYIKLAEYICNTEFVPRGLRGNVPATTAAMLLGREVGLDTMTALGQITVIEGRPGLSAEAMRGLALAAGHEIAFDEATSSVCVVRGRRRGAQEWSNPYRWDWDMAVRAGLAGRDAWKKYPRRMLIARASTDLCRDLFADVIHGFRSLEELADMDEEPPVELPTPERKTRVARKRAARKIETEAAGDDPPIPPPAASPESAPPLPLELEEPENSLPPIAPPLEPEPAPTGADAAPTPGGTSGGAPPPLPPEVVGDALAEVRAQINERHGGLKVEDLPEEEAPARPRPRAGGVSPDGVRNIILHFGRMGLTDDDRAERLMLTGRIIGREIETTNELTPDEAEYVIATLRVVKDLGELRKILDVVEENAGGEPDV